MFWLSYNKKQTPEQRLHWADQDKMLPGSWTQLFFCLNYTAVYIHSEVAWRETF